jgi:hypothetical protein
VFQPDLYRKGNGNREPADLAWFCRDTIVLIYMKRTCRDAARDAEGNFRQARGFMRAWRRGQVLTGQRDGLAFRVPHDRDLAIVILSISGDPELDGILPEPVESVPGADVCATVSERFMGKLAELHGGITDLCLSLETWPSAKAAYPGLQDADLLGVLRAESRRRAEELVGWCSSNPPSPDLQMAGRVLLGFKTGPFTQSSDAPDGDLLRALLVDFSWVDQYRVLCAFGKAAEAVRGGAPWAREAVELKDYPGSVLVTRDAKELAGQAGSTPDVQFEWVVELELGASLVAFRSVRTPSACSRIVRRMAKA